MGACIPLPSLFHPSSIPLPSLFWSPSLFHPSSIPLPSLFHPSSQKRDGRGMEEGWKRAARWMAQYSILNAQCSRLNVQDSALGASIPLPSLFHPSSIPLPSLFWSPSLFHPSSIPLPSLFHPSWNLAFAFWLLAFGSWQQPNKIIWVVHRLLWHSHSFLLGVYKLASITYMALKGYRP